MKNKKDKIELTQILNLSVDNVKSRDEIASRIDSKYKMFRAVNENVDWNQFEYRDLSTKVQKIQNHINKTQSSHKFIFPTTLNMSLQDITIRNAPSRRKYNSFNETSIKLKRYQKDCILRNIRSKADFLKQREITQKFKQVEQMRKSGWMKKMLIEMDKRCQFPPPPRRTAIQVYGDKIKKYAKTPLSIYSTKGLFNFQSEYLCNQYKCIVYVQSFQFLLKQVDIQKKLAQDKNFDIQRLLSTTFAVYLIQDLLINFLWYHERILYQ